MNEENLYLKLWEKTSAVTVARNTLAMTGVVTGVLGLGVLGLPVGMSVLSNLPTVLVMVDTHYEKKNVLN